MKTRGLTQPDGFEEQFQILQHVFGRAGRRQITIGHLPTFDGDPINRQQRENLEWTFGRWNGCTRWRDGRRHASATERRHIQDAALILDDCDHRVSQRDLFDFDFAAQQGHQLDTDIKRCECGEWTGAKRRVVQHGKSGHARTDARPDSQANVLELNLAIERAFDERLVVVLVLVQVDEEREREDQSSKEQEDHSESDHDFHRIPPFA
jgi:hypothetical protein